MKTAFILKTIAVAALATVILQAPAHSDNYFKDLKNAHHNYDKQMEKYYGELNKAQKELRDGDYGDYREHQEKADKHFREAQFYREVIDRLEGRTPAPQVVIRQPPQIVVQQPPVVYYVPPYYPQTYYYSRPVVPFSLGLSFGFESGHHGHRGRHCR